MESCGRRDPGSSSREEEKTKNKVERKVNSARMPRQQEHTKRKTATEKDRGGT